MLLGIASLTAKVIKDKDKTSVARFTVLNNISRQIVACRYIFQRIVLFTQWAV